MYIVDRLKKYICERERTKCTRRGGKEGDRVRERVREKERERERRVNETSERERKVAARQR